MSFLSRHYGSPREFEIRIWIWLGIFTTLLFLMLPIVFAGIKTREGIRFRECQAQIRTDCSPSVLWLLNEWTPLIEGEKGLSTSITAEPVIFSVGFPEAVISSGVYRFPRSRTATISVAAPSDVRTVRVFRQGKTDEFPVLVGDLDLNKETGAYESKITLPSGFAGTVTVFAIKDKDKETSAKLTVDVAAP